MNEAWIEAAHAQVDRVIAEWDDELRAIEQDGRADYDAACARRERLIDEADALCGELAALADRAENATRYCRLIRVLMRADSRYARRFAADVEF